MLANLVFGGLLVVVALWLESSRRRESLRVQQQGDSLDGLQRNYLLAQGSRRGLTNLIIGSLGVAIAASPAIQVTWAAAIYWLVLLGLVVWITFLAMADMNATREYYGRIQHEQQAEQAKLARNLEDRDEIGDDSSPT